MGCLVVTSNLVKLKSISSWPKMKAKTTENHFRFHFHFKWFPALENRRERERERSSKAELADIVRRHHWHHADHDYAKLWSRSRKAPTVPIAISPSCRSQLREVFEFDDFFLGFVCVLRNEWYYIFVWQPRKYEQQVENVFSMVFSRTQPNIRKFFSKIFLKCNQTHENIFLSGK